MLRNVLYLALVSVLLSGCAVNIHREDGLPKSDVLRHVVLFKFKDGTSSQQIRAIEDAFRALSEGLPTAGVAVLDVPVPWAELEPATARLVAFRGH